MAIYHLSVKHIARSQGRSAVAGVCYRSGLQAENLYDGVKHDYTSKGWISKTETILPEQVSKVRPEYADTVTLWNAVELSEKSSDARLATEVELALPPELSLEQQIELVRAYVQENFVSGGRCVTYAIHNPPMRDDLNRPLDKGGNPTKNPDEMIFSNPHAHIMMTCRPIDDKGKWEKKSQIEYLCKRGDETKAFIASEFKKAKAQGWQKQYKYRDPFTSKTAWYTQEEAEEQGLDNSNRTSRQPKTTPYGRENPVTKHWNESARVTEWRQSWEDICNQHLMEAGISVRIDCRSLEAQGRGDEIASVHLGPEAMAMERKRQRLIREGKDPRTLPMSDKMALNEAVKEHNKAVREQNASKVAVTEKLKVASQNMTSLSGEISSLTGVASSLSKTVSDASKENYDKEAELRKSEETLETVSKLNTASLKIIEELLERLASLSIFAVSERKDIQEQIQAEQQKISDRDAYATSVKQKAQVTDAKVTKDSADLREAELNYKKIKQQLDSKLSEYETMMSEIPEEYKTELYGYMVQSGTKVTEPTEKVTKGQSKQVTKTDTKAHVR